MLSPYICWKLVPKIPLFHALQPSNIIYSWWIYASVMIIVWLPQNNFDGWCFRVNYWCWYHNQKVTQLITIAKSIYAKLDHTNSYYLATESSNLLHMSLLANTIGITVSIHISKLQSCRLGPIHPNEAQTVPHCKL